MQKTLETFYEKKKNIENFNWFFFVDTDKKKNSYIKSVSIINETPFLMTLNKKQSMPLPYDFLYKKEI